MADNIEHTVTSTNGSDGIPIHTCSCGETIKMMGLGEPLEDWRERIRVFYNQHLRGPFEVI